MRSKEKKESNKNIVTVKCALKSILRKPFQGLVSQFISAQSIESTKICVLASLLFLEKVERAYETNHFDFFNGDGEAVIKNCFFGVLAQYIKKDKNNKEFAQLADANFIWPLNDYFGNALGDLTDTYATNVINNLNAHCKKRLTQYLKMRVFLNNLGDFQLIRYNEEDIENAVKWAVDKRDIRIRSIDDVAKRERRDYLLQMIDQKSMFDIENHDVKMFTQNQWFKSIQMWIAMQREIDVYNTVTRRNHQKCPEIRNLVVIPICKPTRTHYPMDTYTFYKMLCSTGLIPKRNDVQISYKEISHNREYYWNQIFDLNKIKRIVRSKKKFDYRILSDGVSVSIQYKQKKGIYKPIDDAKLREMYMNGEIECELGIDPNLKTFNATVRRDVLTKSEVNIKTSANHFHWNAKNKIRNAKRRRWTPEYIAEEQNEMNNRNLYNVTPSPLGQYWKQYIVFKMRMLQRGINVYGTEKYTRLNLDKHIETNRAIDELCAKLVDYKSAIVYFGSAKLSPNCPFKIKKNVRAPGPRKIMAGFKKRGNVYVKPTPEDFSSQTCGECLTRFDRRTRNDRFKVCQNCRPNVEAMLPSKIVTQMGKRDLQAFRQLDALHNPENLMSKVIVYPKNWRLNPVAGQLQFAVDGARVKKTVWHRDIAAAKCILIIGHCSLFNLPIPPVFQRQQQEQQQQPQQ